MFCYAVVLLGVARSVAMWCCYGVAMVLLGVARVLLVVTMWLLGVAMALLGGCFDGVCYGVCYGVARQLL